MADWREEQVARVLIMCARAHDVRADREVALAAVQQRGLALEYASPELRADREVVLAAVQQEGWALKYASPELRSDREVVLAAVQQNGRALYLASPELQAVIKWASEELRAAADMYRALRGYEI